MRITGNERAGSAAKAAVGKDFSDCLISVNNKLNATKPFIREQPLVAQWDHRHSTHILWKTIHSLSNRAPPPTLYTSITFNNKIATTPKHIGKLFHQTVHKLSNIQHTRQTDTLT